MKNKVPVVILQKFPCVMTRMTQHLVLHPLASSDLVGKVCEYGCEFIKGFTKGKGITENCTK